MHVLVSHPWPFVGCVFCLPYIHSLGLRCVALGIERCPSMLCRGLSLQEMLSTCGWPGPQASPLADKALECWAAVKLEPVMEALLACHDRGVSGGP